MKAPVHAADALPRAAKGGDRQAEAAPDAAKAPARQAKGAAEPAQEADSRAARKTARLDPPERILEPAHAAGAAADVDGVLRLDAEAGGKLDQHVLAALDGDHRAAGALAES